jgi:riboflavin kinase / FMN adenylyltransferase
MRLIRGPHDLATAAGPTALTIGNFDGVHLGHQAVVKEVVAWAGDEGLTSTVMCFEPTPQEFFAGDSAPARMMRLREKVPQLEPLGLEQMVVLRFDSRLAALSPEAFVDQILVRGLAVKALLIGADFRFGRGRSGDLLRLEQLGAVHGFEVAAAPTVNDNGERISSTRVRAALAHGDLIEAGRLLGRPYSICGRVQSGQELGRELGYPTANLALHRQVVPMGGIFAVRVRGVASGSMGGVASLGTRPTVAQDGQPLLEVHLFDFDQDLYGRQLEVEFVARIRDEERFADLAALRTQMDEDAAAARRLLAS